MLLKLFLNGAQKDRSLQCDQAAQLMPPPRLPRHLRPCHPLGTAIQVRCAHKTARTAFSTDGDETPQSTTGKSSHGSTNASNNSAEQGTHASAETKPWWSAAIGKITSLASGPVSTELNAPTPDTPSASAPKSIEVERGSPVGDGPEVMPGLIRRLAVGEEKSQQLDQHFKARSQQKEKAGAQGQDSSNTSLRRVKTTPRTPRNARVSPAEDMHGQQRHITQDDNKKEEKHVAIEREPAPDSWRKEVASIHQELKRLSDHIRALQVVLEAKTTIEPLSTTATGHATLSTESSVSLEEKRLPGLAPSPPTSVHVAASIDHVPAPGEPPKLGPRKQHHDLHPIYRAAWITGKIWMDILGKTAQHLLDMPPRAVAPVASSLLQTFHAIKRDPIRNAGTGQIARFSDSHKRAARSLANKLVPRNFTDAVLVGENTYSNSVSELSDVANTLDGMQSPLMASIAMHVRNRLRVIAENAILEDDVRVFSIMETYRDLSSLYAEARHSPTLTQQPALILRLEKVLARRRISEFHRATGLLEKDVLRISSALKTKQAVHAEVGNARTRARRNFLRAANPDTQTRERPEDSIKNHKRINLDPAQKKDDESGLVGQIHRRSRSMQSSNALKAKLGDGANVPNVSNVSSRPMPSNDELSEQSLLEELFPEAKSTPQPQSKGERDHPRVGLPMTSTVRPRYIGRTPTLKEKVVESFQKQGEQVTVLQLTNCSTQLTEADFRRAIPKGKHIEDWRRDGDLYKVIPGRDPLSLERLPFYYLLFQNTEAALAYQKNVSRLHKLSALHQPANIFSAIPPPTGFLEEGEDISAAISSYNLLPTHHPLSLNFLMQPYNPALRTLIERGGYQPIAPSVDENGKAIWRVLMRIEGYEPRPSDLFKIFSHDAYTHGMTLPLRNESQSSIHRVRDIINLRMSSKLVSSNRPRAYGTFDQSGSPLANPTHEMTFDDPAIQNLMAGADEDGNSQKMNQLVMNRVYNRWVIDFEDEDSARRWSAIWHRRVLPDMSDRKGAWKEAEEERVCNTEVLW